MRRIPVVAIGMLLAGAPPPASTQGSAVFRSHTNVVVVPVAVTDRSGRFVRNLTADQFEIADDGVRRPAAQFSAQRVPVSLGILLDVSGSMAEDPKARAADDARWADTRRALELLVSRLSTEDESFFAVFADNAALAATWTQDYGRFLQAFDLIRPGGGTALLDAIRLVTPNFQRARHHRKVLLLISDGNDTHVPAGGFVPPAPYEIGEQPLGPARQAERQRFIDGTKSAIRNSDAALYAIGIGTRKGVRIDTTLLEDLTRESGGYVAPLQNPSDIVAAVSSIWDDLQSQYVLAFEPRHSDGKYHRITVKTKNTRLKVRARGGYVASSAPNPTSPVPNP